MMCSKMSVYELHQNRNKALVKAAGNGNLAVVRDLVDQGADIHVEDDLALCHSAIGGHLLVVQYLVEHGANVHADDGMIFIYCVHHGHLPVVRYLVEQGADVHVDGDEALHQSVGIGRLPLLQYLISVGNFVADAHWTLHNYPLHPEIEVALVSADAAYFLILQQPSRQRRIAEDILDTMRVVDCIPHRALHFDFNTYLFKFMYPERTVRALQKYRRAYDSLSRDLDAR